MASRFIHSSRVGSLCAALALSFAGCNELHAVVVASYNFNGGLATSSDTDPATIAGDFVIGAGSLTAVANVLSMSAVNTLPTPTTATGISSFTLTPGASPLSLASLTFDYGFQNIAADGTYFLEITSSLTAATVLYSSPVNNAATGNVAATGRSVDLSANAAFQNLTGPVTFTFKFNDTHAGTTRYHVLDNVVLNTVPEPSSALLALPAVFLLARRSRR